MKRINQETIEKIEGCRIIASISGGKDSAAMSLFLHENGIEHDRVFMDTGWEHDETYAYLRGPLTKKIGPILEIQPKLKMESLIEKKGMFPSRVRRFCTQELKVEPIKRYIKEVQNSHVAGDVINAVGIRRGESLARSAALEWEFSDSFKCDVWRPIVMWSEQDVIDIHKRHNLAPNPLYLKGASRVGCWPCIFARKSEIRMIAETDPGRIDRIRDLELLVNERAKSRSDARGDEKFTDRTFFQKGVIDAGLMPIDEVVEWSKTARGGKQYELFAPREGDTGCMRWGLCETSSSEKED